MPIQKNTTKNTLVKTDGTIINIDKLDVQEDNFGENLGNVNLKPFSVTSIKTSNQTDTKSLGTLDGEYTVLVGQDTIAENGLYKRESGSSTIKNTELDDKNHYFFDTAGIRAIFIDEIDRFKQVYIDNIHIGEKFTTSSISEVDVFDIFVKLNNITIIDLEVIGLKNSGTDIFHGTYKRTFYNNSGNYVDGGNHLDISKTKGTFASPIITFDLTNKKVKLTPGDTDSTTWFIKGKKSM
jgi:hypothetical protein